MFAASPGAVRALRPTIGTGRLYDRGHEQRRDAVALLGRAAAQQLGISRIDNAPAVFIGDQAFAVIGIVDDVARRAEVLSAVVIPHRFAEGLTGGKPRKTEVEIDTMAGRCCDDRPPSSLRATTRRPNQAASARAAGPRHAPEPGRRRRQRTVPCARRHFIAHRLGKHRERHTRRRARTHPRNRTPPCSRRTATSHRRTFPRRNHRDRNNRRNARREHRDRHRRSSRRGQRMDPRPRPDTPTPRPRARKHRRPHRRPLPILARHTHRTRRSTPTMNSWQTLYGACHKRHTAGHLPIAGRGEPATTTSRRTPCSD